MQKAKTQKAKKTAKSEVDAKTMISFYKEMLFYRRFEERVNISYTQQKFAGFCHLHIGQEALCVGVGSCINDRDYVISGYRSHTQAISKGIEAKRVLAELFGKVEGCSRGKGGSMHMFSKEKNFLGGHGIVGAQAPLAVGVGFTIRYRKEDALVVCYLGDAAMNQGAVFEAMNMAATWDLPVLFIIENNQYGMGTAIKRTTSIDHLYKRALAFDMDHSQIDAMDVLNVHKELREITDSIRKKPRPYLLEAMTYRYKGHSVSDPATYRTKEELATYMDQDSLVTLADTLKQKSYASEEELKAWDKEARAKVKEAEAFADAAEAPKLEELFMHVYTD